MKISNPKRSNQAHSTHIDNDFSSIFEESKSERIKPYLIGVGVIVLLIAIVGGSLFAYQNLQSDKSIQANKNDTAQSHEDTEQTKCIDTAYKNHETPNESDPEYYPKLIAGYDAHLACYDKYPDENSPSARLSIESARQSAIDASGDYKETYLSSNPPSNSSTGKTNTAPTISTYDPSKCEPLNTDAANLQKSANQKKSIYDNAFAARKIYGEFYSQYGNSVDAQRAYDTQEAYIKQLQEDWQNTLTKSNAAYRKYQECRATL